MEYFLNNVCNQEWNLRQDKGRPFIEGIQELLKKFPEHKSEIEAYHHRWIEMLAGPISPTVELLVDLKNAGYRLCVLSNWATETFALVRPKHEFLNHFETILISGEEKLIKPDLAFYNLLLERIKVPAAECVFIDDVAENIEAGKSIGIRGIQFLNTQQVRNDLKDLGVDLFI